MKSEDQRPEDRMLHIRVSRELHRQIRLRVAEEESSIQKWIAKLIKRELALKRD